MARYVPLALISGSAEELIRDQRVRKAYLGEE